ncbi:OLC1v1037409C1 [Oldenlandia corymbosa var. corymbosa]|uniref:OLC1v1037409C1 n=1 Tax=Oldenlandia corymbosa var. corymbosa TaxID=529605 RepID=A0AAV1D0T8_OLDCO|nr:OLC1v1037409C1 [Oldenlandia corymbosa var. corymbosa]
MASKLHVERIRQIRGLRLLYAGALVTILLLVISQLLVAPHEYYVSLLSPANISMMFVTVNNATLSKEPPLDDADILHSEVTNPESGRDQEAFQGKGEGQSYGFYNNSQEGQTGALLEDEKKLPGHFTSDSKLGSNEIVSTGEFETTENHSLWNSVEAGFDLKEKVKEPKASTTESYLAFIPDSVTTSMPLPATNMTSLNDNQKDLNVQSINKVEDLLQNGSVSPDNSLALAATSIWRKSKRKPTSISDMNTLLHQSLTSATLLRSQILSARDKELQNARFEIERAPIIRNAPYAYSSLFRNYSMFMRSYELMERLLRVYIYKEGQKPIFHQPYLRGIYASEGWFLKLMEGNRKFVVRDPKKAHLFYLPFSTLKLREMLHQQNFTSQKDLENLLNSYIHSIAKKYVFWNRTGGADHFLVACHDWAPRLTRSSMGSCLRALCNCNIARGFEIGKDVSLPVTYIRSAENPGKYTGGNDPLQRPILAFFAGGMHGYLRPILLQNWSNKEPDMKIFGPMSRDSEGKARYREFMKSSKYCICARGYEVHTPRVIESIYYECVPVIISDDYVPPFFEILNWESFAVFVLEADVPNLRNILLSIPEKRYMEMQNRLKLVQQHFVWHKIPVKFDLFHMILHSIWYNRVFRVKSR